MGYWCVNRIYLPPDRNQWQAFVNAVMNLQILENYGNILGI
jgi:hypothetical protein